MNLGSLLDNEVHSETIIEAVLFHLKSLQKTNKELSEKETFQSAKITALMEDNNNLRTELEKLRYKYSVDYAEKEKLSQQIKDLEEKLSKVNEVRP